MSTSNNEPGGPSDPPRPSNDSSSTTTTAGKKRSRKLARELQHLTEYNGKRARRDLPKCPICEERIDPAYWQAHYEYELGRLDQVNSGLFQDSLDNSKGKKRGAALAAKQQMERSSGRRKAGSAYQETLDKVRKNRQKRTNALRRTDDEETLGLTPALLEQVADDVQTCFICNQTLHGDSDAINLHIDNCLAGLNAAEEQQQQQQENERWGETYEWAGETRVRATALMEGGYSGAGFATARKDEDEDVDEDLDVEDVDEVQYGESQYTERDIVVDTQDEDATELRAMVSGATDAVRRHQEDDAEEEEEQSPRSGFEETVSDEGWQRLESVSSPLHAPAGTSRLVIESLKSRIQQLESASRSAPRCLICLEPYKKPLTSIVCWHVHCEQCWLHTLGSKKLCPQCQKITTPADLRRIYM